MILECMKTCEAYNLAYELKIGRHKRAIELAKIINIDLFKAKHIKKVINGLYLSLPCSSWLTHMCEKNGISIKNLLTLEAARKKHCHINRKTFLKMISEMMKKNQNQLIQVQ